jgi:hypothetical protein
MTNLSWQRIVDTGRPLIVSEPRPVNVWIFSPNALSNQYWDPTGPEPEALATPQLSTYHAFSSRVSSDLPPSGDTSARLH